MDTTLNFTILSSSSRMLSRSRSDFNKFPILFLQWVEEIDLLENPVKFGKGRVTNEKQTAGSPEVKGEVEFVWEGGVSFKGHGWGKSHTQHLKNIIG